MVHTGTLAFYEGQNVFISGLCIANKVKYHNELNTTYHYANIPQFCDSVNKYKFFYTDIRDAGAILAHPVLNVIH